MDFFSRPQVRYIMLNEWQQRDINAIMFSDNYMLIAQDEKNIAFMDFNIDNELFYEGLKSACEHNPSMVDLLTNLVIDLHTKKKEKLLSSYEENTFKLKVLK